MNTSEKFAIIMAQTGIYFAKCDNHFAKQEEKIINQFTHNSLENSNDKGNFFNQIQSAINQDIALERLIENTNKFLSSLQEKEAANYKKILFEFVEKIIKADNKIDNAEVMFYEVWSKQII